MRISVAIALLVLPVTAMANCYAIRDRDERNYCLASFKNQQSYCYSIKDADDKNLCLATTKPDRSHCYMIKDSDKKNLCFAQVPQ